MAPITITTATSDADWEAMTLVDAEAFTSELKENAEWMALLRPHIVGRLAAVDGVPAGCYMLSRVEQRFGGRDVPAAPVSTVAVRPDRRGTGVGAALMRDLAGTAREMGCGVAPLWAAVPRFYRRWGWGVGDRSTGHTVRIDALLPLRGRGEPVRDPRYEEWTAVWRAFIEPYDGGFVPPEWAVRSADMDDDARPEHRYSIGWREDGRLTGYVRFSQRHDGAHGAVTTRVHRFCHLTGDALRGLLSVLGSSDGQGDEVTFVRYTVPPRSALNFVLADPHRALLRTEAGLLWMQRITDLGVAVRSRGWNPTTRGEARLEIRDPLDVEARRVRVTFEDGTAEVHDGGGENSAVALDVTTLASWYSGSLRMADAVRLGLAEGPAAAVALLDDAIPRREVWLGEMF